MLACWEKRQVATENKFDQQGKKNSESQWEASLEHPGRRWYKEQESERIIREKGKDDFFTIYILKIFNTTK